MFRRAFTGVEIVMAGMILAGLAAGLSLVSQNQNPNKRAACTPGSAVTWACGTGGCDDAHKRTCYCLADGVNYGNCNCNAACESPTAAPTTAPNPTTPPVNNNSCKAVGNSAGYCDGKNPGDNIGPCTCQFSSLGGNDCWCPSNVTCSTAGGVCYGGSTCGGLNPPRSVVNGGGGCLGGQVCCGGAVVINPTATSVPQATVAANPTATPIPARVCVPNKKRCDGNRIWQCNLSGMEERPVATCEVDEECRETAFGDAACVKIPTPTPVRVCSPGRKTCEGNKIWQCNSEGTGEGLVSTCATNEVCRQLGIGDAACVRIPTPTPVRVCIPETVRCGDNKIYLCNSEGTGEGISRSCTGSEECRESLGSANCIRKPTPTPARVCGPGDTRCVGNTIWKCSIDGVREEQVQACELCRESLNGAYCTRPTPTPMTECAGCPAGDTCVLLDGICRPIFEPCMGSMDNACQDEHTLKTCVELVYRYERRNDPYECKAGKWEIKKEANRPTVTTETEKPKADTQAREVLDAARVTEVSGSVSVGVGAVLAAGQSIKTGEDSSATIELPDGSIIRLGGNTYFTYVGVQPNTLETRLKLWLGEVWAAFVGGPLEIETPQGVTVVRGTVFGVSYSNEKGTSVVVQEGSVEYKANDNTESVKIGANKTLTAPVAAVVTVKPVDVKTKPLWVAKNQQQDKVIAPIIDKKKADREAKKPGVWEGLKLWFLKLIGRVVQLTQ